MFCNDAVLLILTKPLLPCLLSRFHDSLTCSQMIKYQMIKYLQQVRRTMFQYQSMDCLQHDLETYIFSLNQQVGGWVGWIRVGTTAPLSLCFSCHWNARRSEQSSLCLKLKHAISTFKTFWCSTADKDANNPDSENEDKKLGMCGKFWDRRSRGGVDKQTLRLGRDGRVGAQQRTAH